MRRLLPVLSSLLILSLSAGAVAAQEERSPSPEGAEAYFINLSDGDTVASPFLIQFGLRGMGIAPAGADFPDTGHHHLLIDQDLAAIDPSMPLLANDEIRHFGGGQTETTLELEPGTHTLQIVLGNHIHVPHDPVVSSAVITVTVE